MLPSRKKSSSKQDSKLPLALQSSNEIKAKLENRYEDSKLGVLIAQMNREGSFVERSYTMAARQMQVKSARLMEQRQALPSLRQSREGKSREGRGDGRRRYQSAVMPPTARPTARPRAARTAIDPSQHPKRPARVVTLLLEPVRGMLDGSDAGGIPRASTAADMTSSGDVTVTAPPGGQVVRGATLPDIKLRSTDYHASNRFRSFNDQHGNFVDDDCDPDFAEKKPNGAEDSEPMYIPPRDKIIAFPMSGNPVVVTRVRNFMEEQRHFNYYNPLPGEAKQSTERGRYCFSSTRLAGRPRTIITRRGSSVDSEDMRQMVVQKFRRALRIEPVITYSSEAEILTLD